MDKTDVLILIFKQSQVDESSITKHELNFPASHRGLPSNQNTAAVNHYFYHSIYIRIQSEPA